MNILGISAFYHDSAAALIRDGEIIAAAQEERFTRKKHDPRFPSQAIAYCLREGGIQLKDLDSIVFYDKPILKFDRLLETYLAFAPRGVHSFVKSMPVWLKEKLYLRSTLKQNLAELGGIPKKELPKILFTEHHQAHAASAFFPSPFQRAAVLCLDGVGEWATSSLWLGDGNQLTPQWEIAFPHSLGLLYSAFTYFAGFKVNSGEYKLMGLAPYGEPKYKDLILDRLMDLKEDGTFRLNLEYFDYPTGLRMTGKRFEELFQEPARAPEGKLTQKHMDLARSIQEVTEEVVLRLGRTAQKELDVDSLCLAGGVALNCVANGRLLREGPFKEIWIQPAAGDAGGALGAAFAAWHQYEQRPRRRGDNARSMDSMRGSYLGPEFKDEEIQSFLEAEKIPHKRANDPASLECEVAEVLAEGNVVGWFQGRMEFGPRALGARSILGDARSPKMQSVMNLKIKYRESFRPFAPAVLAERVGDYFELDRESPYMLLVANVKPELRIAMNDKEQAFFGIDKLNIPRSTIPAVTHIDYSARIQTVHQETHARFYGLLKAFEQKTGCAVLVNTSFNVRGEPIVQSPEDAYRCFMRTEMDYLILGNFIIDKRTQGKRSEDASWQKEFELD